MLFWRFLIASLWMAGAAWWRGRSVFTLAGTGVYFFSLALCALSYGSGSLFYFMASRTAGTGLAMVVFFSYPMFVALHSFYKKGWRIDQGTFLSLVAIPIGLVFLMERRDNTLNAVGIVLAIVSAVSYAVYIVKSKSFLRSMGPDQFTSIVCIYSAVIFLIMAIVSGDFHVPTSWRSWAIYRRLAYLPQRFPFNYCWRD